MVFASVCASILSLSRGPRVRTYHWSLLCEVAIVSAWVAAFYTITTLLRNQQVKQGRLGIEALVLIGTHM